MKNFAVYAVIAVVSGIALLIAMVLFVAVFTQPNPVQVMKFNGLTFDHFDYNEYWYAECIMDTHNTDLCTEVKTYGNDILIYIPDTINSDSGICELRLSTHTEFFNCRRFLND